MYLDKEYFESYMERILAHLGKMDKDIGQLIESSTYINGERLMDNHDVCQLLKVSKRTLQRYRSSGTLPYRTIYHKTYYKESDVYRFIENHFGTNEKDK